MNQRDSGTASEILGWYQSDPSSERVRVRIALDGEALILSSMADQLLARWSLKELRNLSAPVFDRQWVIGDRRLAEPTLTIENDEDYSRIQRPALELVPPRMRAWYQVSHAAGNPSGLLALVLLMVAIGLAGWLWPS